MADALSRREDTTGICAAISLPQWDLFESVKTEQAKSEEVQLLLKKIQNNEASSPWTSREGILLNKNRIFIPKPSFLVDRIISTIHNSCHEGYQKTLHRITRDFFWTGMRRDVVNYVSSCLTCQRHKVEQLQPAGLLQPLPIPHHIWSDISMDFVEGLPSSHGRNVIFVVVDRFSKYAHFLALPHPYTSVSVAKLFFDNIFKLHGLPETIVSDRDVTFTSSFWKELFLTTRYTTLLQFFISPTIGWPNGSCQQGLGNVSTLFHK